VNSLVEELSQLQERVRELPPEAIPEIAELKERIAQLESQLQKKMSAWDHVQLSRHENRPYTLDYIKRIFKTFRPIHGDRKYADDPALIGGLAVLENQPVMVVGQQKGRNTKERLYRNYGMSKPEGYRKAIRLMMLAEKFNRPVLTFIDTPGAYPGMGAEERGQAEAIAYNLRTMARLRVPILVTILGEGGSGGALAIGVGDRVLMLQHSIYSVISPESCSAILWRDQEHAKEAAENLKLTAADLQRLGVIDEIVPEPQEGAHTDWDQAAILLKDHLLCNLEAISRLSVEERLAARLHKFRSLGAFSSDRV
jgi:acetyl-CoA carboxylase carboxyl transferase subunit alpha